MAKGSTCLCVHPRAHATVRLEMKGAGRNTIGKARREENEDIGENSVNRSGQPPFVLLEPQKEQKLTNKMTRQQHVGQAGKHFHLSPTEVG